MEKLIQSTTRRYGLYFYISIGFIVGLYLLCRFDIIPEFNTLADSLSNSLQSIIMMVILLFIPLTLSFFRRRTQQFCQSMEEPADRVKAYGKMLNIRLSVFNVLALLCILMHLFISSANAKMLLLMVGIFYLFILPNKFQMCRELGLNPDGSIFVEEPEPEVEKVGNFVVMEEDDDDDFIPKNPKPQVKTEDHSEADSQKETQE